MLHELVDVPFELGSPHGIDVKVPIEFRDKVHERNRVVIEHRDVARRLIGDVNFMALIDQTNQGAAHRDHVVIRMRRED